MAIKAVISIIDDKSEKTYIKNHVIDPFHVSEFSGQFGQTRYDFNFHFNIANEDISSKPSIQEVKQ